MTFLALVGSMMALAAAPSPETASPRGSYELAQLTFRSRVVVRMQTTTLPMLPLSELKEKKGPRCILVSDILAAGVLARTSVDLVLRGGYRVRARFSSSCPGLDYYSGFYLVPSADGKMCADRDVIRDRAGGECAIDKFRQLVAKH